MYQVFINNKKVFENSIITLCINTCLSYIGKSFKEFNKENQATIIHIEENKDINGSKPSEYSTKKIWVSSETFANLPKVGTPTASGKTRYFEEGYKELKSLIKRPPLELNGFLKLDFTNGIRQVEIFEYTVDVNQESYDKIEKHFLNFFKMSDKEKRNLIKRLQ